MAEDPIEAEPPRTRDVTRVYDDGRIRVLWDATLCIHTGICLRQLPSVFDVNSRRLQGPGGGQAAEHLRVALCRCGASENKPYCDNSHRLVRFRDE